MSNFQNTKMSNKPKSQIASKIPTSGRDSGTHSRSSSVSNLTTASDLHSETGDATSENTEEFKIGEHVWVNGSKPGCVKFIGKTQFAPGIWAGILLDEPVGKNDGTVAGVSYFTCEPLRGIFARPSKLTRTAGAVSATGDSVMVGTMTTPPKSSNVQCSRVCVGSNISTPSPKYTKLKLEDRITVSSLSGLKTGTLKFIGETDFAKGEWAGIELDEPTGKNDGSVAGKRYFTCELKHGLFAPLHKVSRFGMTPVSRPGSVRGAPLLRSNSRDSLSSSVSNSSRASRVKLGITSLTNTQKSRVPGISSATKAFEEAIKEKEQHIEQLLKERELDRAEFARLASHFEQVDAKSAELEKKQSTEVSHKKKLEEQLTILQKKLEDIQFQLEEEKIIKTDFELQLNQRNQILKNLEDHLSKNSGEKFLNIKEILAGQEVLSEINDTQITSVDSCHLQEKIVELETAMKLLSKEKQEILNQLTELQKSSGESSTKNGSLVMNLNATIQEKDDMIINLKKELNNTIESVTKLIEDNKNLSDQLLLKEEEAKGHADDVIKELGEKINVLSEQLKMKSSQLAGHIASIEDKDNKITSLECNLKDQADALLQLQNEHKHVSDVLKFKDSQCEENIAAQKSLEEAITALKSQLETDNSENQKKINLLEEEIKTKSDLLNNYLSSIEEKENLISSLQQSFDSQAASLLQHQNENKSLNDFLNQKLELIEKAEKKMLDLVKEIEKLTNSVQEKEEQLLKTQSELNTSQDIIQKLNETIQQLSEKIQETDLNSATLTMGAAEKVNQLQVELTALIQEKSDMKSEYERELTNVKSYNEKLSSTIGEQEKGLFEKEELVKSLQSKLKDRETEISNVAAQNADLLKNISKFGADFEEGQKMYLEKLSSSAAEFDNKLKDKDKVIMDIQNDLEKSKELLENKAKDLNSKDSEINVLKNVIQEKESQFDELSKMIESSQKHLTLLKEQNEKNESLLQSKETFINDFKADQEKQLHLKEQSFKEEILKHGNVIQSKIEEINSKELHISNLEKVIEDKKNLVNSLQMELEAVITDKKKMSDDTGNIYQELNDRIKEMEEKYSKLLEEKEKISKEELQTREAKKNLEQVRDTLLQEKSAQEEMVRDRETKLETLQAEVNRMRTEFTQHKQDLQQKLDISEMELQAALELKNQLDIQHNVLEELQQELHDSDEKCQMLETEIQVIPVITSEKNQLQLQIDEFQKINKEKSEMLTKMEEKNLTLEEQLNNNKNFTLQKEKEVSILKEQLQQLTSAKVPSDLSKSLEEENLALKNKISFLELERKSDTLSKAAAKELSSEEVEEKSQIDFLNSIIVDLKQKNEKLTEQLEAKNTCWEESDINLNETKRAIAPRLYCDICEMFDLHETDDCPKQESFIDEVVPQLRKAGTRQLEERPYCTNCEIFGHWTVNCAEPDTF